MKDSTLTQKRQRVQTGAQTREGLDTLTRGGVALMGGVSALIALWAATCFIGGLISAGGPVELAYSWFKAIAGL
ncbi:MAG: hypothetical protein KKC76_03795 [Proteobacteria bacterium]|nr:hypothetical protein [Pseudomonadota bacterium]MBU4294476.1 hypothetical protein [Pseudomonadota bacterium]MCG2749183.1 hypothetical protein [Desulfobulbaceae bacterium]